MIVRKILLLAATAALMSTPALALGSGGPANEGTGHAPSSTPVGPPSTTPDNTGNPSHPEHPTHPGHPVHPAHPGHPHHPAHPRKSHKCIPHNVAYVASGTFVAQTLSKNADGTYSGSLTVDVTHTNHHAAGDLGMTAKIYTLTGARVRVDIADVNHDGSVGLDDLQAGDRVKLIGSITTLGKKCDQTGFTAQTTIVKVVFHEPPRP
ncbi:MAG TPA: hypothetical protein VHS55_03555 [Solirubrobacteraceae bacterium]|jgi:hypothetical protein|nr:hypothetical protein [Solirubrobacteraceae bacterium]